MYVWLCNIKSIQLKKKNTKKVGKEEIFQTPWLQYTLKLEHYHIHISHDVKLSTKSKIKIEVSLV